MVEVETATASPFAGSLLFEYVATLHVRGRHARGRAPRAGARRSNRDLLRELLGQEELRDLHRRRGARRRSRPTSRASPSAPARAGPTACTTCCAALGDLTADEVAAARGGAGAAPPELDDLIARAAGRARARGRRGALDRGRGRRPLPRRARRDAALRAPRRLPGAGAATRCAGWWRRYARTQGPVPHRRAGRRWELAAGGAWSRVLAALEADGTLVRGEFRPGGSGREWCDAEVLRRLRRASLAALRQRDRAGRAGGARRASCPAGSGSTARRRRAGRTPCARWSSGLQGLALPPAQWEAEVLPRRLAGYGPAWLDELAARGEVVWVGAGARRRGRRPGGDLLPRGRAAARPAARRPAGRAARPADAAARGAGRRARSFWDDLLVADARPHARRLFAALWGLVWAGEVTNDLWLPLRAARRLPPLQRPSARRRARGGGSAAPARRPVAGRRALVARRAALPRRPRHPTSAAAPWPSCCWSATAC